MEPFKFTQIAENGQQMNLENLRQKERIFAEKLINEQINPQICCKLDENVLMDCIKLIRKYNLNLNRFDLSRVIKEKKIAKLLKFGIEKKIGTNFHLMMMNTPAATIWETVEGDEGKIMMDDEIKKMKENFELNEKRMEEFANILFNYNQHPDKDFAKVAIRSLLKRINCRPNQMEQFIKIIISLGSDKCSKNCIKIKIPKDRRLQIKGKKLRPHFLFCKLFRWSNLENGKCLKAAPFCEFSYCSEGNSDWICVNPYHYERMQNKT